MAAPAMTVAKAKDTFIEGGLDLLLYLKKLLQRKLDTQYAPEALPDELVSAYNQLIILLNNSISGLRLPASMIRSMLSEIRITFKDLKDSANPQLQDLIKQLELATNLYIGLTNCEQSIDIIARDYKDWRHPT